MNLNAEVRYVAIGDSLTEGLGDESVKERQGPGGWADRLAALISQESLDFGYANLALRGCNTRKIELQANRALELAPSLVTIMTGANDLMNLHSRIEDLEARITAIAARFCSLGAQVVLVTLIDPNHVSLAKVMRKRAKLMSQLINRVGAKLSLSVVDLNNFDEFSDVRYWSQDLAHFSAIGHKFIANQVANKLGLKHRYEMPSIEEIKHPVETLAQKLNWVFSEALPFISRRLQGKTAGDSLQSKHQELQSPHYLPEHWLTEIKKVPLTRMQEELIVSEMGLEPTPA